MTERNHVPKQRTDPLTDESGDEHHPAFGVITLHRVSSSPGEVLFQSDVQHREYMRVSVHEATRKRDLQHDRVHPGKVLCEVSLSVSQFASFVAGSGIGGGIPCTIDFTGSGTHEPGSRPGLNLSPRLALSHEEVRAAAAQAYGTIQKAFMKYQETLAESGKGSAAKQREALRVLQSTIANAAPNVAYAAKKLDEHAEEVVEKSRADLEAMVTRMAERAGISPDSVQAIETAGS